MLSCEISSTTPPRFSVSPVYPLLLVIVFALLMSFPAKADSHAGAAAALRSDQITFPVPVVTSPACGRGCRCSHNATVANCSYANLAAVPPFPASTRVLVLDWNHIRRLDENHGVGAIQPMTSSSLELLSISHNNLSDIAPTSLRGLDSLHQLRLDHNRLERLPAAMFADTPSLGVLSLAGNSRLGMASLGAALNASRLLFLRFLDLSRVDTVCAVDARLPEAVFSQLPALQHLVLCDITIANMSADFFTALSGTSLATLDLGGSSIGKVNDTSLAPLAESLEQLVLDRAIVSPRALDAMFAGLAAGGNKTRLLSLSLRNVFVDDTHDAAVGHHLFRHLSLTRLKTLHMDKSYAGIRGGKLPSRLLHPLKHLQLLTLSKSGIRSMPSNAFHGMRHLKTLVLRHNHLSCERQSDCSFMSSSDASALPHLTTLDLADNLLVSADSQDGGGYGVRFSGDVFPSLVELDLSANRLTAVTVGSFDKLARLQTLRLSSNPLTNIESGALDGCTALVRLELNRCDRLTHLRAGALAGLVKLRVLSARDAGLIHVHHAAFTHLTHLEELYLRNNQLGDQGESIKKLAVKQSKLRVVDLGSNRFKTLPSALLKNSPHLNALHVDNNHLSNCSQIRHLLRRAAQLEFVDLSENRLVTLDKACFDVLAVGVTVKLGGNPFQCTCDTAGVVQWLADSRQALNVADRDSVSCSGPPELSGTRLLSADASSRLPGSWQCHWWHTDVVVAVVVLLGLTLLVIVIVQTRRRFMLVRRRQPNSASIPNQNPTGSVSSVIISNSCYGNGAACGGNMGGATSAPGGGESNARYSSLIEDDLPPCRGLQQVPVQPLAAGTAGKPVTGVLDVTSSSLTVGHSTWSQQLVPAHTETAATSCGDVDNEALLPCQEVEESV